MKIDDSKYKCVAGKILKHTETKEEKNKSGYNIIRKIYEANSKDCCTCKYKKHCTKSKKRTISFSERYETLRKKAKDRIKTKTGIFLTKMRGQDVETVFADRKYVNGINRFILKGINKVRIGKTLIRHPALSFAFAHPCASIRLFLYSS